MSEELKKYRAELEAQLKNAKEEREKLLEKATKGEKLTLKENSQNKKLAEKIKDLESRLDQFYGYDLYDQMKKNIKKLGNDKTSADEKNSLRDKLTDMFKRLNENAIKLLKKETNLSDDEIKDIAATEGKINRDLDELEKELENAKKRNYKTKDIEKDIEEKKDLLKLVQEFREVYIPEVDYLASLDIISNSTDNKEKQDEIKEASKYFERLKKDKLDKLNEDVKSFKMKKEKETKDDEEKKSLRERTKEKSKQLGETLKENWKKVAIVSGAILLAIVAFLIAMGLIKNNSNKNSQNNNSTNQEDTDLTNNSTNQDNDKLYTAVAEQFGYDYETAKELTDQALAIANTGFFDPNEYSTSNIVEITDAVNNKTIYLTENAALDQAINAQLTGIYNNYMYGTITDTDLKKVTALNHFAKDNSELDKFLTTYSSLLYDVLYYQFDEEQSVKAKNAMYEFLNVFANSYAGYIPADSELTAASVNSYSSAVMTNTFNWEIAYETFVRPMMSAFPTEATQNEWTCLQINMLSNHEKWVQLNCTEDVTLTLGGK